MSLPEYTIIRSRRRTIALIITPDEKLVVRAPLRASDRTIHRIVDNKKEWIRKKLDQYRQYNQRNPKKQYVPGELFWFLGKKYPLQISPTESHTFLKDGILFLPEKYGASAEKHLYAWYHKQARSIVEERVRTLALQHGFTYRSVRVSKAIQRWGSCGPTNTLNFSWKLVMAPPEIIDYVVIHELCHTKIKNHSAKYWELVRQILPDYSIHRKWLRENRFD